MVVHGSNTLAAILLAAALFSSNTARGGVACCNAVQNRVSRG